MTKKLPELTHAEVIRRLQIEIERVGNSQEALARQWHIKPRLLQYVMRGERNVGPTLLRKLKLRRVTLIVHRYVPTKSHHKVEIIRKRPRGTERRSPE